jgi:putative transposase
MPRKTRIFVQSLSLHVIHRGHNRDNVFQDSADCEMFLGLLRRTVGRHDVELHAYTVMTNHYHLLVTPGQADALPLAMKDLNSSYTRYCNARYGRVGTIWTGRYRGLLIDDERYWLTCLRYIEQNPVRAGMVACSEDYPWCSYAAHALGRWPSWLTPHAIYQQLGATELERQTAYRHICSERIPDDQVMLLRNGVRPQSDPVPTPF